MRKLLVRIFRVFCWFLFLFEAWHCLEVYTQKRTVSNTYIGKQELHPKPHLCITTDRFNYDSFNNSINISHEEYIKGRWRKNGLTAEQLWSFLTPDLHDLISKISVQKTLAAESEQYNTIHIPISDKTNFTANGLEIVVKDYYWHLRAPHHNRKLYWGIQTNQVFFHREDMFPHGVQSVYVHPKSKFILTIVAPGKYYFAVRKQNQIDIETENSYGYIVRNLDLSDFIKYSIFVF